MARHFGGTLVLRIEDTDRQRSTAESERMILDDIMRLDLQADEGPFRQSERLAIYQEYIEKLLIEDKAYYCYCTDEVLEEKKQRAIALKRPPHYDGHCAKLTERSAGPAVVRFRTPQKAYVLEDQVAGRVQFPAGMMGDFVLMRSDGSPVYTFCCVVDDHLMRMTHVVRAAEHVTNTVRQLMLYEAFGWQAPTFAHMALVLGQDRQKLSKRSGDVSVREYLDKGYLPEALLNFLYFLGFTPAGGTRLSGHPEILTREEMIASFDSKHFHASPAVFDLAKLRWMNGFYIQKMPLAELCQRVGNSDPLWVRKMASIRGDASTLEDLPRLVEEVYGDVGLSDEARLLLEPCAKALMDGFEGLLVSRHDLTEEEAQKIFKQLASTLGMQGKAFYLPLRALITGVLHGPELRVIASIRGPQWLRSRINHIRQVLL